MYKPTITAAQKPKSGFHLDKKIQIIELSTTNKGSISRKRLTLTIDKQILPAGESKKKFVGYPTIFHAYFVIEKNDLSHVSIIYQTEVDPLVPSTSNPNWFGRFYVYACKNATFKNKYKMTTMILPSELPQGASRGIVVNITPHPRIGFQEDIRDIYLRLDLDINNGASALGKDVVTAHRLYRRALISTSYFQDEDIETSSSQNNQDRASYGFYNSSEIHIERMSSLGSTMAVHPSGSNIRLQNNNNIKEYCGLNGLGKMNFSIQIGEANLINPLAKVLLTLAHEGVHVLQGYRASHILDRWRLEHGSLEELREWIKRESSRRISYVGLVDIVYVLDKCDIYRSGVENVHNAIELEAYLNTFILALSFTSDSEFNELFEYLDKAAEKYVEIDPLNKWTRMMFDKYTFGISLTYSALGKSAQEIILKEVEKRAKDSKTRTLYTWISESISVIIVSRP